MKKFVNGALKYLYKCIYIYINVKKIFWLNELINNVNCEAGIPGAQPEGQEGGGAT